MLDRVKGALAHTGWPAAVAILVIAGGGGTYQFVQEAGARDTKIAEIRTTDSIAAADRRGLHHTDSLATARLDAMRDSLRVYGLISRNTWCVVSAEAKGKKPDNKCFFTGDGR